MIYELLILQDSKFMFLGNLIYLQKNLFMLQNLLLSSLIEDYDRLEVKFCLLSWSLCIALVGFQIFESESNERTTTFARDEEGFRRGGVRGRHWLSWHERLWFTWFESRRWSCPPPLHPTASSRLSQHPLGGPYLENILSDIPRVRSTQWQESSWKRRN